MLKDYCLYDVVLIEKGHALNNQKVWIHYNEEKILAIDTKPIQADEMIDGQGLYVSSGWIDFHTHVFKDVTIGLDIDEIGYKQGVTMVVDAGSAGASNIEQFNERILKSVTEVKLFLNLSRVGLEVLDELSKEAYIDIELFKKVYQQYDHIVGIKLRASQSVMKEQSEYAFKQARLLADQTELPIMVHIGNAPPTLLHILKYLTPNDIITHCFHGKPSGIFSSEALYNEVVLQKNKGMYFDIGHGQASFSLKVYQRAMKQALTFDSISSDLHNQNIDGPVYSLSHVMDKFLSLGMSLEEVIEKVTMIPATKMKLNTYGKIISGNQPNFTLFNIEQVDQIVHDSESQIMHITQSIQPKKTIIKGKVREVTYEKYA